MSGGRSGVEGVRALADAVAAEVKRSRLSPEAAPKTESRTETQKAGLFKKKEVSVPHDLPVELGWKLWQHDRGYERHVSGGRTNRDITQWYEIWLSPDGQLLLAETEKEYIVQSGRTHWKLEYRALADEECHMPECQQWDEGNPRTTEIIVESRYYRPNYSSLALADRSCSALIGALERLRESAGSGV